ncbi:hypothetical protein V5799_017341, partial [Amblyomma americanum]
VVFGLMFISMFLSIWINNVAITAMMMPVVNSLASELLRERRRSLSRGNIDVEGIAALRERAAKIAAAAAAASGNIKVITHHDESAPLFQGTAEFCSNSSLRTLLATGLTFVAVVPFFFRCKSPNLGKESSSYAMAAIRRNYTALGPVKFHEVAVLLLFTLLVFLWLFRDPMFAKGWATYFDTVRPKDATAVMIPVILLFMIPAKPWEGAQSPSLLSWQKVQARLQWSVMLLIGCGFAVAEGMRVSGLSQLLGQELASLGHLPPVPLMICLSIVSSFLSELVSNSAACVILLPVFANLAQDLNISPLLLLIPTTLASNYAFLLPVGTPANAMVYEHGRLTLMEMVVPGALVKTITMFVTVVVTCVLGDPIFGMFQEAKWAAPVIMEDLNTTVIPDLS